MDPPRYTDEGLVAEFELLKKNKKVNPPKTEEEKVEYRRKYKQLYKLCSTSGHRRGPYKTRVVGE